MRWAGHVARIWNRRGVYRVMVGKPEGKRPLGRPRRRWEDNIKMDLQKVGCGAWTKSIWLRIGTVKQVSKNRSIFLFSVNPDFSKLTYRK
jgi:hypothetical protein